MAIPITIPRLGWSMEEGVFAGWLKRDGDEVRAGEPLFSLEGDKATQEIEALDSGILKVPPTAPAAGTTVAVGAVIGFLLERGEIECPNRLRVLRRRRELIDTGASCRAGQHRPLSGPRPAPQLSPGPPTRARARHRVDEAHRQWKLGAHSQGRRAGGGPGSAGQNAADTPSPHAASRFRSRPRPSGAGQPAQAIAAKMMESRRTTAPVTLTTTADATNLVALRRQFKAAEPQAASLPGFTDFLVKLTAIALTDHPLLNARWSEGDDQIVLMMKPISESPLIPRPAWSCP